MSCRKWYGVLLLQGSLEDELHDEPGQGLDEEEEEVYDALNDETFGTDAFGRLQ